MVLDAMTIEDKVKQIGKKLFERDNIDVHAVLDVILLQKWIACPKEWMEDDLSFDVLNRSIKNCIATFNNHKKEYENFSRIFECVEHLNRIEGSKDNVLHIELFLRGLSAYFTACQLSLMGRTSETYTILRSCIEYAGYGFYIYYNDKKSIWSNRKDDRNKFKKDFTHRNMCNSIKQKDENLSKIYDDFYNKCIDYGAHPNRDAIDQGRIETKEDGEIKKIEQLFFQNDKAILEELMMDTSKIGVLIFKMYTHIFYELFEEYGINKKISDVEKKIYNIN